MPQTGTLYHLPDAGLTTWRWPFLEDFRHLARHTRGPDRQRWEQVDQSA